MIIKLLTEIIMEIMKESVSQFEYKIMTYYGLMKEAVTQEILKKKNMSSEDVLNELGKDGWELITILQGKENCLFIFKRSKLVEKKAQGQEECKDDAWNEEDEDMLKSCLRILYARNDTETMCTKWLKSLKARCTWKPSDKQIRALRWVLNNIPYNKHKEEISGLLEQIKDL